MTPFTRQTLILMSLLAACREPPLDQPVPCTTTDVRMTYTPALISSAIFRPNGEVAIVTADHKGFHFEIDGAIVQSPPPVYNNLDHAVVALTASVNGVVTTTAALGAKSNGVQYVASLEGSTSGVADEEKYSRYDTFDLSPSGKIYRLTENDVVSLNPAFTIPAPPGNRPRSFRMIDDAHALIATDDGLIEVTRGASGERGPSTWPAGIQRSCSELSRLWPTANDGVALFASCGGHVVALRRDVHGTWIGEEVVPDSTSSSFHAADADHVVIAGTRHGRTPSGWTKEVRLVVGERNEVIDAHGTRVLVRERTFIPATYMGDTRTTGESYTLASYECATEPCVRSELAVLGSLVVVSKPVETTCYE